MIEIVFEDGDQLVALVLDAVPEERHRATAKATEQEVERGVDITDHVRRERRVFSTEVVISNTPIATTAAVSASLQTVSVPGSTSGKQGLLTRDGAGKWQAGKVTEASEQASSLQLFLPDDGPLDRVNESWATLMDAMDRSLLAVVTTGIETYEDMALVDAATTRTAKDGTWLRADLTFAEIRQVSTQLVADPAPDRPRGVSQQDRGSQPTEEAEPGLASIGTRIVDGISGLF